MRDTEEQLNNMFRKLQQLDYELKRYELRDEQNQQAIRKLRAKLEQYQRPTLLQRIKLVVFGR